MGPAALSGESGSGRGSEELPTGGVPCTARRKTGSQRQMAADLAVASRVMASSWGNSGRGKDAAVKPACQRHQLEKDWRLLL